MKPERWDEIEALCQAALDRPPEQRSVFLTEACGEDQWLRDKVEYLLAFESQAEDFIETPPGDVAADVMAGRLSQTPTVLEPPAASSQRWNSTGIIRTFFTQNSLPTVPSGTKFTKPLFYWLICGGGIILGGYLLFAGVVIYRYSLSGMGNGVGYKTQKGVFVVSSIEPRSEGEGKLQVGDRVLAIDGDTRFGKLGPAYYPFLFPNRNHYTMQIARGETQLEVSLQNQVLRRPNGVRLIACDWLLALCFYVVGFWIGIFKPNDRAAQMASATTFVVTAFFLKLAVAKEMYNLGDPAYAIWFPIGVPNGFHLALAFHFFYRFPSITPKGRFWTASQYLLYGGSLVFTAVMVWIERVRFMNEPARVEFALSTLPYRSFLSQYYDFLQTAAFLLICAVIFRNFRLLQEPSHRRRIKWLIYGSLAGLVPQAAYSLVKVSNLLTSESLDFLNGPGLLINLTTLTIPFSVAYVILKHQLFDISVVVRAGLKYLLAKRVLQLTLALPALVLVLSVVVNPHRTISEFLFQNQFSTGLVLLTGLSLQFRRPLGKWIDRRFFREAYDQEQILLGLIEEIKDITSLPEIAHRVSRSVDKAFHPNRLYVFFLDAETHHLTLGYSSGSLAKRLNIPKTARLLSLLEGKSDTQDFPFPASVKLPVHEQVWLTSLRINLLVPLNSSDHRLVGLLLLGEKKSEEPYSPRDRRLLFAIGQQMAGAYQIGWLQDRVGKEKALNREVLSRLEQNQVNVLKECPSCGTCYDVHVEVCLLDDCELVCTLPVERTIDQQYRLEKLLGKGGMGAVYEATDLRLERQVAVKLMTSGAFNALRRFEREARASARLNHPNIITVHTSGLIGNGSAYLVMELVRGKTLRSVLQEQRQLDPQTVADLLDQLLEGLKAAHDAGVIHRDLKPENVFLGERPNGKTTVKLLDFGLAKFHLLNPTDPSSLTTPGMVMGTFGYMSPEQLTGGEIDERSDLFSIGILIIEALTGTRPFEGRNYPELLTSVLHQEFHLAGDAQEIVNLDEVLQRCIAKAPANRFPNVAALQWAVIPAIRACAPFPPPAVPLSERNTESFAQGLRTE